MQTETVEQFLFGAVKRSFSSTKYLFDEPNISKSSDMNVNVYSDLKYRILPDCLWLLITVYFIEKLHYFLAHKVSNYYQSHVYICILFACTVFKHQKQFYISF